MSNSTMKRRSFFSFAAIPYALALPRRGEAAPQTPGATELRLPLKEGSIRFAVMGDTGRGDSGQYEVAAQMAATHKRFPFNLVIMAGDNIYGGDSPAEMKAKFDTPYKPLIDAGVEFRASLGNHDNPNQRFYKPFNMGDEHYYTFHPPKNADGKSDVSVRFFALDTNYLEKAEIDWLEKELASSISPWKIAFFHHPLYSSGKTHGSALETRAVLEPMFLKYGVSVVFAGHDHFYERIKPQVGGIGHWVSGAGGSLRKGDIKTNSPLTAKGFDTDYHFMIVEIVGDDMYYQAISRRGVTIDSGVFHRPGAITAKATPTPAAAPVLLVPAPVPASVPPALPVTSPVAKEPKEGVVIPRPSPTPKPTVR